MAGLEAVDKHSRRAWQAHNDNFFGGRAPILCCYGTSSLDAPRQYSPHQVREGHDKIGSWVCISHETCDLREGSLTWEKHTIIARNAYRIGHVSDTIWRVGHFCLVFGFRYDPYRVAPIRVLSRTRDTRVLPNLCTSGWNTLKNKRYNEKYPL